MREHDVEKNHYCDVIMTTMASQITSLTIVYSAVYSGPDRIKHQSSASLAFVWGIHRGPVNSPHKWSVTRKMFPFDDVIMYGVALLLLDTLTATYVSEIHTHSHQSMPVTSYERHGASDHGQFACLFNNLLGLKAKRFKLSPAPPLPT